MTQSAYPKNRSGEHSPITEGADNSTGTLPLASQSPRDDLELEKLRAEIQGLQLNLKTSESALEKQVLEHQKLKVETEDIRFKIQNNRSNLRLERLKVYPTYLAVVVSILFGVFQYFQQREAQLAQQAKDQEFKITNEMVTLVKQLDTASSPALQRSAAIQLAMYGLPAVPILIENLDIDRKHVVHQAIIKSLQETVTTETDAVTIITSLLESSETVFSRELQQEVPNVGSILAHIEALGALSTTSPRPKQKPVPRDIFSYVFPVKTPKPVQPNPALKNIRAKVEAMLIGLQSKVKTSSLRNETRNEVEQTIKIQITKLPL